MKTTLYFSILLSVLFVLSSCENTLDNEMLIGSENELLAQTEKAINSDSLDVISPLPETEEMKLLKERLKEMNRKILRSVGIYDYSIREELLQIEELPFYLQVKEDITGKRFLTSRGYGNEIVMDTYRGEEKQQFYIKILPAVAGIPYLIYSKETNTPIRIGAYQSNPKVKVIYASQKNTTSLFGASWDIKKGEATSNSYVIENQDIPEQGNSGAWHDIYYNVIGVNKGEITLSKYSKSPRQEFEIVPVEKFAVQEVKYSIDASATLEKLPDIVLIDRYTNNGHIDQKHNFSINEQITETSSFNRKTSYSVNVSTEIKVKVPFIASGKISTSITGGQEFSYGKSDQKTRSINRTYEFTVPAKHRAEFKLTLFKYNIDVEYTAVCKGETTGRVINVKGRWNGVNIQESDATLELTPLNGKSAKRTIIINKDDFKTLSINN